MSRVVCGRVNEKEAASTSEMIWFGTDILRSTENLTALMDLSGTWNDLTRECAPPDKVIMRTGQAGTNHGATVRLQLNRADRLGMITDRNLQMGNRGGIVSRTPLRMY